VDLGAIAEVIHAADRFVVASHMNPDGDAIGSVRAMQLLLVGLGKDVVSFIPGAVVPPEFEFVCPDGLSDVVPDDLSDRVLIAIDCGNAERLATPDLVSGASSVINIDHHGDNTHFGHLNHVRATAACSTALVWELAGELGIENPSAQVATAVYIGLVTDTGRFQYSNTTPEAFELAAALVRAGVDTHDVFSRIFESQSYARVRLLGRALERSVRSNDGHIIATHLRQIDFVECEASEDDAEGIVDALRSVVDTDVAVFLRDLTPGGEYLRKGSLRTTREDVDVSAIARSWVGGGHRQAAGFNTDDELIDVVSRVEAAVRDQRDR
jgi:phosphoesterase RecJ-like protein